SGEPRLDVGRDRNRLEPVWIGRIGSGPHPRLEALDRKLARLGEPMYDVEARAAEFGDPRLDDDVVTKPRRDQETRTHVDHRKAADLVRFAHARLVHAEHLREQMSGAVVEDSD